MDDLRTKAKLAHNQMIGLKYCSEFLERTPRDEVTQIENVVCKKNRNLIKSICFQIFNRLEKQLNQFDQVY